MSRVWPADYDAECYVLLPVPASTIPIVAGKLGELEQRSEWATDADWEQGYQFAVCLQECLMQCGQSFAETMTLLAISLGANEVDQADLAPVFPALAARLAAARAADTAGVLGKAAATAPPSAIIRLSELLAPFVQAGNPAWPAEPNVWGMLRSTWNFGAYWSTDAGTNGATEATTREIGALLAVLAGLQEQQDITPVTTVWPNLGTELEAARGRETGGGTTLLVKKNAAEGTPSDIIRLSEIARLLQGKFPDTGTLWWYEAGQAVTLYDIYTQQSGLTDEPADSDGVNWIDYISDLVGIPTDLADLLDAFGLSPGKLKKDGLMIALIAVEFMNLSMTSNLLLNLIGKDKMFNNSPGAPAATHDYMEALLTATRGVGIQRSETDWAGESLGAGLAPDGTPPGDSVLQGIRGDTEASATRNIIDTQPDVSALTTIDTKIDALLQGSDLGDGRVNLWTLDQSIDALLTEMQAGQIFSKLDQVQADIAIMVDNGQHTGKINLRDVKTSIEQLESILGDMRGYLLGIEGDTMAMQPAVQAIQTAVDFILAELNKLMDTSGYTDRTNLHDLLQELLCICRTNRQIMILQPNNEPYGQGSEPGESTAAPSDLCQRAHWLMDVLADVGYQMFRASGITSSRVQDVYMQYLGVAIPGENANRIALMGSSYMDSLPPLFWGGGTTSEAGQGGINMKAFVEDNADVMRCTIVDGGIALYAHANWNIAADGLGAGALPLASILKEMVWAGLLNQLFAEQIPLDNTVLSSYSNDCSDCAGIGDPTPGGDLTQNSWSDSEAANCGQTQTINGYKYRPTYIRASADWNVTRANTNGYLTGDCGALSDDGIFITTNMFDYELKIVDNQAGYGYDEVVAQGGTVFWVDDPQGDSDLESAATSQQITDGLGTVTATTSYFTIVVKYPDTLVFPPNPLVRIWSPES